MSKALPCFFFFTYYCLVAQLFIWLAVSTRRRGFGYALDVTAKLIALICLMTLKEQIFLLPTAGRSMSKAVVRFFFFWLKHSDLLSHSYFICRRYFLKRLLQHQDIIRSTPMDFHQMILMIMIMTLMVQKQMMKFREKNQVLMMNLNMHLHLMD